MNDNKRWDKLISMPEEYEKSSSLADRATAEIEGRKTQVKKSWFQAHWKKMVACVAPVALLVGIGIPVYKKITAPPPVVYYASSDLISNEVPNISAFIDEKGLGIGYFDVPNVQSKAGTIKETGKVALLYQKLVYVSETGFDQIELNVVLEKNITLDFYKQYSDLVKVTTVNGITANYSAGITKNGFQQIYAKFTCQEVDYYLDVVTLSEPEECIGTYVTTLVG